MPVQEPLPVVIFSVESISRAPPAVARAIGPMTGDSTGISANRPAMPEIVLSADDTDFSTSAWSVIQLPTELDRWPQKPGGSSKRVPAARLIAATQSSTAAS